MKQKKMLVFLMAVLLVLPLPALCEARVYGWQGDVAVYEESGLYGLMGQDGPITEPVYSRIGIFDDSGLAIVEQGELAGAIDPAGRVVIPLEKGRLSSNRQQLDPTADRDILQRSLPDGEKAFYLPDGTLIGGRSWQEADLFYSGSALVRSETGWGLLSRSGEMLVEDTWLQAETEYPGGGWLYGESEGIRVNENGDVLLRLEPVPEGSTGHLEFISWRAVEWYDPQSGVMRRSSWDHVELLASDRLIYWQGDLCGLALMDGTPVTEPCWEWVWTTSWPDPCPAALVVVWPWNDGMEGRVGLVGRDGQVLAQPRWAQLDRLSETVFLTDYSSENGTVDTEGNMISIYPDHHAMEEWQPGTPFVIVEYQVYYPEMGYAAVNPATGKTFHVFDGQWKPVDSMWTGRRWIPVTDGQRVGLMDGPGGQVITHDSWLSFVYTGEDECGIYTGEENVIFRFDEGKLIQPETPLNIDRPWVFQGRKCYPVWQFISEYTIRTAWMDEDGRLLCGF